MTVSKSKRIVTFMLCLFLCVMFIVPPQPVDAVLGTATLVAGGWAVGSEVIGSVIAALIMAATGVCFDNGFFGDTDNLSTMAYEQGYKLVQDMIASGGNVSAWLDNAIGLYATTKGFTAGDEIEVPAEVLEYTRTWVNENYDFGDVVSISHNGIVTDSGEIIQLADSGASAGTAFVPIDCTNSDYSEPEVPIICIGDIQIRCAKYIYQDSEGRWRCRLTMATNMRQGTISNDFTGTSTSSPGEIADSPDSNLLDTFNSYSNAYCFLSLDSANSRLCFGYCKPNGTITYDNGLNYVNLSKIGNSFVVADSTLTGSDSLSIPQTEDITITVPDVSMGDISGYSVPAIQQLTGDMVLPAPGAGEVEGDNEDTNIGDLTPDKPFYVPDTWTGFNSWMKTQSENFKAWRDTIGTSIDNLVDDVTGIGTNVNDWITEKWGDFTDTVEGIPGSIASSIENIIASVLDVLSQPVQKLRDKFDNVVNKILPFFQGVGNLGLSFLGIWHYVITWVGTLAPWINTMFMIWSGLPYAMVVPIYATAAVVIVIGIYRRFFM